MRAVELLAELGADAVPAVDTLVDVLGWPEPEPEPEAKPRDGEDREDGARELAWHGWRFLATLHAKRAAARALGHCGAAAQAARPALKALKNHDDARLRYRAALALRRIG